MLVTAINRTDDMILIGPKYLLPGEGRPVTLQDYLQARARHGAGLESPDAPPAAVVLIEADAPDEGDEEPDEYSLDVLDGDADARALEALSRAELVEMARTLGLVPGRRTKRELIEAIHEYAD
jgi:hypothetical protein